MKRIAIFAHYSTDNKIDDYVIFYLKELKKVAESIIFVSDTNIEEEELDKIKEYTIKSIAKKHGEYDFGSYKIGYLYALNNKLLSEYEELIFANDSCYAPLFQFTEMFNEMSNKKLDFWGVTQNSANDYKYEKIHIQSYFIVFKSNVFNSDCFKNFIFSIKKEKRKDDIIQKYEIELTIMLSNNGYKWDVYSKSSKTKIKAFLLQYKNLIREDRTPFLKRSIVLQRNQPVVYPYKIKELINNYTDYEYSLIKDDISKNQTKIDIILFLKHKKKKIFRLHISEHRVFIFGKCINW